MELEWTPNFFVTVWTGMLSFKESKAACRLNYCVNDLCFIVNPPQIPLT